MMKVKPVKLGKTERMSFSHIDEVISMPNLIEVQKNSYQWFLDEGLKEVFHDIGTIEDYTGNLALSFVDFRLDKEPKYSIKECKERDVTYAAPLRVTARLLNKETGEVKDQEIFMGDFPLMTDAGTFVINGAERAIVSQLVRSPGVFYGHAKDKVGNDLYSATMNPNRGAWLEYETDAANVFYVRIDKNRKLPVTVLCRALGLSSNEDILNYFGEDERILATLEKDTTKNREEGLLEVYRKLRPGEPPTVESATSQIDMLFFDPRRYDLSRFGRYKMNKKLSLARRIMDHVAAENVVDPFTGEILVEADKKIDRKLAERIDAAGVNLVVLKIDDPMKDQPHKVKVITNGCVDAQAIIDSYYPAFKGVDVKECGINERCCLKELRKILDNASSAEEVMESLKKDHDLLIGRTVTIDDILSSINYLNGLGYGIGTTDDIDHLGNRRIRSVGELLQNQFRIGFSRMERVIRERMTLQSQDQSVITPQALINIRPVVAAIKEFFGSSPLSQFMDQNNPLAELTHKRRLSALGPGGLSRDRAGFEVRDVHYSHYGRMCPIETPEGPNIGLISYLASYAKINEYGFVEAPYRKVKKIYDENNNLIEQVVTDEVEYMTADVEDEYVVAQANEPLDEGKHFIRPRVSARRRDEILEIDAEKVDYMDVSPRMMVSVATACIPFLENDDCNRALMGSNMQRQAVPLMVTQQPIVATGMEYKAATDSGTAVLAKSNGVVEKVDADHVVVRNEQGALEDYSLIKFARSNAGTCINQRPIVEVGETVTAGQVLADGPAMRNGEISLGKNALIGFMTWEGYNYEDAVLLNEKIVREDVYTSIHIEEYETESRDTKLGPEEITR
ncbi:MAG: DNA-directed RNA polymerase subunit beta, partial [Faecalibacterium prausnitzii]